MSETDGRPEEERRQISQRFLDNFKEERDRAYKRFSEEILKPLPEWMIEEAREFRRYKRRLLWRRVAIGLAVGCALGLAWALLEVWL